MLNVRSLATRYPASNSEFRTSIENGYDEDVDRTESDTLNGFPAKKLTLQPGGCGFYEFPIQPGEINAYVQPAKKEGDVYWDYCDKAPVNVKATTKDNAKETNFECFYPDESVDPCSSKACHADISSILTPDAEEPEIIKIQLCTDQTTNRLGAIWEINFSRSNDSSKLEGFFVEKARQRFRTLQDVPDFNTQLSFVSIVGGRGVGKSTVASLLSGNASMFTIGSGTIGTTTTGADVSTVIPSLEWSKVVEEALSLPISKPDQNYPLFLIDSEGMGIRGDAFDFMTTSPPAIIAKNIIWIGAENVQTVKILEDIASYLNGLDNIVIGDQNTTKWHSGNKFCEKPKYGQMIVIINKMMGGSSDIELQKELMEPEPDYIPGSEERNNIRAKMTECFDGINVHGLPMLSIPEGEDVDYPFLNGRFKDGLAAIVNSIIQRFPTPRIVTVAGNSMELNATNVEVIIGTVIEEANNGKIDLNGFSSFWTFIKQEINATLGAIENELKPVAQACTENEKGLTCSKCVCEYRNNIIDKVIVQVEDKLEMAKTEAMNLYQTDLAPFIADFLHKVVMPWQETFSCVGQQEKVGQILFNFKSLEEEVCDLSAMNLENPGQPISLTCDILFMCDTMVVDSTDFKIESDKVYIGETATVQNVPPAKGKNGNNGINPGDNGSNGEHGTPGFSMTLTVNQMLRESGKKLNFISQGGSGGDGGKGMDGKSNLDKIPSNPTSAKEVYDIGQPSPTNPYEKHCSKHCGGHCNCCDEKWHHVYDITTDACGGNGGNGGDGGNGGPAGILSISGTSELEAINNRLESSGGAPGIGGVEASGLICNRHFTGYRRYWESPGCHGFGGLSCGPSYHEAYEGYTSNIGTDGYPDQQCPGKRGTPGQPGNPWKP